MALINLSSPDVAGRETSNVHEARNVDLDAALAREQYRALAQLAPYFYGAAIATAATISIAACDSWSPIYAAALPCVFLPFAATRARYWLRRREQVDSLSLEVRRDLRRTAAVSPALAFTLSLLAAALPENGVFERSVPLTAVWVTAAASAFCLTRLADSAALVVFAGSAPLIAFLARGGGPTFWFSALLLVMSCLVIVMVGENYRAFAAIVRSRILVAERHRAAEEARQAATAIANTEYLTSLPNRRWLQSLLAARVEAGRAGGPPFAVGLLDLDGFKPISDIHGHPAGDRILKQAADRLAGAVRGRGHVARMGGDEFASADPRARSIARMRRASRSRTDGLRARNA